MSQQCNICGNEKFGLGPNGRRSVNDMFPRCTKCQSLERHRVFREVMLNLRGDDFSKFSTLQFSQDKSIEPTWFDKYECSIYRGDNSLDLQDIDRPDKVYDLVICNHVLEHVENDGAALNELGRIIKNDGYVFLTFPSPINLAATRDWGYPDEKQHGHYRIYGKDVIERFSQHISHLTVLSIYFSDPVTGVEDIIYFLCKSAKGEERIFKKFPNAETIQSGREQMLDAQ